MSIDSDDSDDFGGMPGLVQPSSNRYTHARKKTPNHMTGINIVGMSEEKGLQKMIAEMEVR